MRRKPVDNSIIVEKMEVKEEIQVVKEPGTEKEVEITVKQAVDMLAGYQQSPHTIVKLDTQNGVGECLICGEKTNAVERCICWKCHGKYMKGIYQGLAASLINPEDKIKIKVD